MTLRWVQLHADSNWTLFNDQWLLGQVVRYSTGWQSFRSGHRVEGGPWTTQEEAKAALEGVVSRSGS